MSPVKAASNSYGSGYMALAAAGMAHTAFIFKFLE